MELDHPPDRAYFLLGGPIAMAWNWNDQGTPPGHVVEPGAIGTVSYQDRPYAFVRGNDGHLWVNWFDGSAWHWSDQGTPPGHDVQPGAIGTVSYQDRPYAFVRDGEDLWVNWWSQ